MSGPIRLAEGITVDTAALVDPGRLIAPHLRARDDTAVLVLDRRLRVLMAEGKPFEDAGFEPAAMEGRLLEEILPPSDFARVGPRYEAALRGDGGSDFTLMDEQDGPGYRVELAPIRNAAGATIGLLAAIYAGVED